VNCNDVSRVAAGSIYQVRIAGTEQAFSCPMDMNLLEASALQLGGNVLRAGCRSGGCGVCRVQIESGRVRADRMSQTHVSSGQQSQGYVLACRAYPLSDVVLRPAARVHLRRAGQ
jgi:ferredoxin